jgi:hypothetical protein
MLQNLITPRRDFGDTLVAEAPGGLPAIDPIEQLALADRADWTLLHLVLCAALATMVLALASSLPA